MVGNGILHMHYTAYTSPGCLQIASHLAITALGCKMGIRIECELKLDGTYNKLSHHSPSDKGLTSGNKQRLLVNKLAKLKIFTGTVKHGFNNL
jgi:hypothetical protein